jgi:hypothetical protein
VIAVTHGCTTDRTAARVVAQNGQIIPLNRSNGWKLFISTKGDHNFKTRTPGILSVIRMFQ